jgi:hypothetical protein
MGLYVAKSQSPDFYCAVRDRSIFPNVGRSRFRFRGVESDDEAIAGILAPAQGHRAATIDHGKAALGHDLAATLRPTMDLQEVRPIRGRVGETEPLAQQLDMSSSEQLIELHRRLQAEYAELKALREQVEKLSYRLNQSRGKQTTVVKQRNQSSSGRPRR